MSVFHSLPIISRDSDAQSCLEQLRGVIALGALEPLVTAVSGNAPYLARLMLKYPAMLEAYGAHGADGVWKKLQTQLHEMDVARIEQPALMQQLRILKSQAALTIALADISGDWSLPQVTGALSALAESAVQSVLKFLLLRAHARGELALAHTHTPEQETGIIILGMGKLGGLELNYSSDIDLIVLFDQQKLPYTGAKNPQHFMNKLASDLVTLMEERTPEGYVFRTDLRLRPDPMSTPLAVTIHAALAYYETVGQNWERAAMIKARPIAGDVRAAAAYMRELVPFIWRKTLDFATIADIHSIKRQMNVKAGKTLELPGHNVKTGMGGIREIEFFVQTLQLVWGGRIPELRVRATCEALAKLTEFELVTSMQRDYLTTAYSRLRQLEHRLQMRQDEQTHRMPTDTQELYEVACFSGYADYEPFAQATLATLTEVHRIYTDSMEDSAPLAVDGNLVFTGVEADPDTLDTLKQMGYGEVRRISDIIQGWHRGHRRSTRSKRSRQVLTELVPALLTALAKTAHPDAAFFHFDDFLDRLPSGAQIFSLFLARPEMLRVLADILGSAPALGDTLSNNPALLDSVLEADFFDRLPTKETLENLVSERLRFAHAFEQKMIYLRTFNNEKRFQAGVHLLKRLANPREVGIFLSDVAEVVLQSTLQEVLAEYSAQRQHDVTTPFAVLGLGKLGGREMTFGSDLDIVFLYDDAGDAASDLRLHMTRISQRLVSALTLLTREGRLYEVDTRLRPGGSDGPLAVNISAFDAYFENSAWTYEHMALTRARVVATNQPEFVARVEEVVARQVLKPRDADTVRRDMVEMRGRLAREFATTNPWTIKHVRGGMVDLDFMAQYLVLRYGAAYPALWHRSARAVFESAQAIGILPIPMAAALISAKKYLSDVLSVLRLSAGNAAITADAPPGLKQLLSDAMREADFEHLALQIIAHEANTLAAFQALEAGDW